MMASLLDYYRLIDPAMNRVNGAVNYSAASAACRGRRVRLRGAASSLSLSAREIDGGNIAASMA
ncbi:hypothetical protein [Rhizorhapis suberifaciens]|uniref:Uncharacterized protein n=1 Tax=Rhizorhapis suberifaciens TaxID=13656 RepID=A0A840HSM7_9SPHN|nr:hypothetical protein [Rhizorhapis suberifaciens]MBB4640627.1 hypothetical protein [Rhizorhapis suberifaciens]